MKNKLFLHSIKIICQGQTYFLRMNQGLRVDESQLFAGVATRRLVVTSLD
jgi:hypothetical protein